MNDTDSIAAPGYNKGLNWRVWVEAVQQRVSMRGGSQTEVYSTDLSGNEYESPESAAIVRFRKEAVLDMLSLVHYAVPASHKPPAEHITKIKSKSLMSTKVGYNFFNFESFAQSLSWRGAGLPVIDQMGYTGQLAVVQGASNNSYGFPIIDYFDETRGGAFDFFYNPLAFPPDDWGARGVDVSKHLWLVDLGAAATGYAQMLFTRFGNDHPPSADTYAEAMRLCVQDFMGGVYGGFPVEFGLADFVTPYTGKLDFIVWDQVYAFGPLPFGSTVAIPASYTQQRYRDGWNNLFSKLRIDGLVETWGNHPTHLDNFSAENLPGRFVEHAFRNEAGDGPATFELIKQRIREAKENGLKVCFGIVKDNRVRTEWMTGMGPGVINGVDYGTWEQFHAYVQSIDAFNNVIIQAGRSEADGYLFWNEFLEDPREHIVA